MSNTSMLSNRVAVVRIRPPAKALYSLIKSQMSGLQSATEFKIYFSRRFLQRSSTVIMLAESWSVVIFVFFQPPTAEALQQELMQKKRLPHQLTNRELLIIVRPEPNHQAGTPGRVLKRHGCR